MTYQQEIARLKASSAAINRARIELREELAALPPITDETEELRAQVIRQAQLLRRILDSAVEAGGFVQPVFEVELSTADMLQIQAEVFAAPLPERQPAAEPVIDDSEECPF